MEESYWLNEISLSLFLNVSDSRSKLTAVTGLLTLDSDFTSAFLTPVIGDAKLLSLATDSATLPAYSDTSSVSSKISCESEYT